MTKSEQGSRQWFLTLFLLSSLLAIGHGVRLAHFLGNEISNNTRLYESLDTFHYRNVSETLFDDRPTPPIFRERVLLPILMAATRKMGLHESYVLFFVVLLHVPTTMALAYLSRVLGGGKTTQVLAMLLYALYPNNYRYATLVIPDLLHAQLATCAWAATVGFSDRPSWKTAIVSSMAWVLTLLTRPTFHWVGVLLVIFLWLHLKTRATRYLAIICCLAPFAVPFTFSIVHKHIYGVFTPSFGLIENVHRAVVPRMRMMERHREDPTQRWSALWSDERDRLAMQHPGWDVMALYAITSPSPRFASAYRQMLDDDIRYIRSRFSLFVQTGLMELERQVLSPPIYQSVNEGQSSPDNEKWMSRAHKLVLIMFVPGTIVVCAGKTSLRVACGTLLLILLSLVPSLLTWWITADRLRIPADFLGIPVVAMCLSNRRSLMTLLCIVGVGIIPMKLLPEAQSMLRRIWLLTVSLVTAIWLFKAESK